MISTPLLIAYAKHSVTLSLVTSTIIDCLFNLDHESTFRLRIAPGKYISRQFIIFKYRILRSFKYNASLFEDFKDRK